jgi:leader peptidase (prepilin peptidase)/N-methyltransferase
MPVLIVACALGAVLFGAAGWLGKRVAVLAYGDLERNPDGPEPLPAADGVFAVAAALIGVAVGLRAPPGWEVALLVLAVFALAVCAATDMRTGRLPDPFTVLPLLVILGASAVRRDWAPLLGALFVLVPFALLAVCSRGRGMGWGDVKLATFGGALLGMSGITAAAMCASIAAYAGSFAAGRLREPIAFGPYLALAIGVTLGLCGSA